MRMKLIRMEIMMPWIMTMTAMTSRFRCSCIKCHDPEKYAVQGFSANCAFNKAWWLPDQFKPCGDKCEGALCFCLRWYQSGFPVYQPLHR